MKKTITTRKIQRIIHTMRGIWAMIFLLFVANPESFGQQNNVLPHQLTLQEAIALSKAQNKQVRAVRSEENATIADLKDAKNAALPGLEFTGDYQRFTKLTLYNDFLADSKSIPKRPGPNGADLSVSAAFNLYSGGRQRSYESEQNLKKDIAGINVQDQSGNISLQVAAQYLNMVNLTNQKRFIEEQIVRAETRLKNINALYKNEKVTRSDVLRAELNLSAVKLNLEQAENDIRISNQKLDVLIDIPDTTRIVPTDSANMLRPATENLLPLIGNSATDAYSIRRANENVKLQNERIKSLKTNYAPSLFLYSAYLMSYPNTIFYPPVDQAYSIGFVGIKVKYNISALYQNKQKVSAGKIRLEELQLQQQSINDNTLQQASSLLIKYQEALDRIAVNEKSIEQARVNYKIVNAKYLNQLALLTDLLDADNLYQETRYNLVQAQTGAQLIYFSLLYTSGKL
ncbi:TolC family protein [Mucilaginibacter sp. BT774]|uniref:TolC family protein n=1 Tax=Mucilaginibacter sp. BT774 TaxID=3062276 RepID=UPI0026771B79|nr:TolC family protein [Mucilaginibacter sp. BT774]MDO3626228.1 TolC family protein [Mucilaginibacter sp. BT774]